MIKGMLLLPSQIKFLSLSLFKLLYGKDFHLLYVQLSI